MSMSTMQADDLKYNLVDRLVSVRDINILQKINDLIGKVDTNNPVFKITDGQTEMLLRSEEDIRKVHLISNDDLNAEKGSMAKRIVWTNTAKMKYCYANIISVNKLIFILL